MRNLFIGISIILMLPTAGCINTLQQTSESLVNHPKGEVRYPAQVGDAAGMIVGIPVTLVFLPVTIPLGHCLCDDTTEESAWFPFYPAVYCQSTGVILTGGVPYLLFGWWGIDKPEKS